MSKRRNTGDIVRTRPMSGFSFEGHRVRLIDLGPDSGPPWEEQCWYSACTDPECREWCNAEIIDDGGRVIGDLYHISECQMDDDKESENQNRWATCAECDKTATHCICQEKKKENAP